MAMTASSLLVPLAWALVASIGCAERSFYFSYSHHGEDWMDGECASRDRQSPIDIGSTAPWKCDPPKEAFLRNFLGPESFKQLFPWLAGDDAAAPAPGPAMFGMAPAAASASFVQINMTESANQFPMFTPMGMGTTPMPTGMPGYATTMPYGYGTTTMPYGMTTMPYVYATTPLPGMPTTLPPMWAPSYWPAVYHMQQFYAQMAMLHPPTPPPMVVPECGQMGGFFFKYDMVEKALTQQNNGHTISVDLKGHGLGTIFHEGYGFDVLSINFHVHSEHTFNGKKMPLELHIVHREPETDHILVVAIPFSEYPTPGKPPLFSETSLLQKKRSTLLQRKQKKGGFLQAGPPPPPLLDPLGETSIIDPSQIASSASLSDAEEEQIIPIVNSGAPEPLPTDPGFNDFLADLYDFPLPKDGESKTIHLRHGPVDILTPLMAGATAQSLPEAFFQYRGSLTAPPCSEQVTWLVRKEPLVASRSQLELFRMAIMEANSNFPNARSVMPLMGRSILYRLGINGDPPPPPSVPNDPAKLPKDIHVEFRGVNTGKEAITRALETAKAKDIIASAIAQAQQQRSMMVAAVDPMVAMRAQNMPSYAGIGGMFTTPLPQPNPEKVLSRIADAVADAMDGSERAAALAAAGVYGVAPAPATAMAVAAFR